MVFEWTFTINPRTPKGVYLLHPVTQTIVYEISYFVYHDGFVLLQKIMLRS